jgi:MFS transporter, DHA3 family, macrolide efflux protein
VILLNEKKEKIGYLQLFKHFNYLLIWLGQSTAGLGDSLYQIAFYWLTYQMTSSAWVSGFVILAASAPYLFFGLLGGAYADRWNRKRVMLVGDAIRLLSISTVPILYWTGHLEVWYLAIIAFMLSTVRCFFSPALRATLPQILPKEYWSVGNSFLQAAIQMMRIVGPMIGGLLITLTSASFLYLLTGISFLISFLCVLLTKIATAEKKPANLSVFRDIYETFLFVKTIRPLFWSIFFFLVGLLAIVGLQRLGLPRLSDNVWHASSKGYGLVLSSFSVGNMLFSLVIGKVTIKKYARFIFVGWALWGVFFLLLSVSSNYYLAIVFAFLAGASEALIDMPQVFLLQNFVPNDRLGKVFSMQSTAAFIGESGSSMFAGALINSFGAVIGFAIGSCLLILVGLVGLVLTWSSEKMQPASSLQKMEG